MSMWSHRPVGASPEVTWPVLERSHDGRDRGFVQLEQVPGGVFEKALAAPPLRDGKRLADLDISLDQLVTCGVEVRYFECEVLHPGCFVLIDLLEMNLAPIGYGEPHAGKAEVWPLQAREAEYFDIEAADLLSVTDVDGYVLYAGDLHDRESRSPVAMVLG